LDPTRDEGETVGSLVEDSPSPASVSAVRYFCHSLLLQNSLLFLSLSLTFLLFDSRSKQFFAPRHVQSHFLVFRTIFKYLKAINIVGLIR